MQTIAIYNFKGGSFKTTATHTLATGLAIRGKRVLVIDTDPQAHATKVLGIQPRGGLYDLMARKAQWRDVLEVAPVEQYSQKKIKGGILVVPGNDETQFIPLKVRNPLTLRNHLAKVAQHFDVCLIDTSPTPSMMSAVIYLAADKVLYPTKCEVLHIDGLQQALDNRDETNQLRKQSNLPQIEIFGVLPAIYRKNTLEHSEYLEVLKQEHGQIVWQPVADRIVWAEAARMMQPVFTYAPGSKAADDAWRLIQRFEGALQHGT